tara:strand:+ start:289 stop:630 length:342 start_codon:yes stop_codon:yes gene_type:complete
MFDLLFLLPVFLFLSVGLNILLVWYSRKLMLSLYDVSENIRALAEEVSSFDSHLNSVHELEVFYGDETLGNLIRHSAGLIETLDDFAEIYTLFDEEEEEHLTEEVPNDANTEA